MNKRIFYLVPLVVLVLLIGFNFLKIKEYKLEYNKEFPSDVEIYHFERKTEVPITYLFENQTLLFYLKQSCNVCIENLDTFSSFVRQNNDLNIILLWEDDIPIEELSRASIEMEMNYQVKGRIRLSKITPLFVLIDSENKVDFISNDIKQMEARLIIK
ncbi:hypothetical protein [Bacillus horti]|uniref:Thioredoxin domain-containing protein n=1 Tax=Caldalkalibacillus horti TaxID=77523 RepID=A0ABT9VUY3_9BACI|nr:hypothetical protein [Bacillus horti]MDQ0164774.1 hypothetical protein [Bacillus horti]